MSALEATLAMQLLAVGVPEPEREYRFHPTRRWRFDFAWPDRLMAVEVEGGGWNGGRHTRGKGFASDMVKYSEAMRLGWTVYRCDGGLIQSGEQSRPLRQSWVGYRLRTLRRHCAQNPTHLRRKGEVDDGIA
ncbi:hypothetical protein [Veronia nyctiphanis]|uniref:hypothetical protein n=1 Tax=Veronia nyctiphanis TaxID=1278244 RepID=UPI00191C6B89|nr:hypothetical protein [Veronia nyctiphanis]